MLFGQWGFGADDQKGITVLLHGQPGTGKSLAAEALGYEVGKPLKVTWLYYMCMLNDNYYGMHVHVHVHVCRACDDCLIEKVS